MTESAAPEAAVATSPEVSTRKAGPYAWYALGLMVVVYILNYVDRQILSILAEDIKKDLGLSDADLGFLFGTAFAIFYSVFGIPLGRLVDGWRRGRLMAIGLTLWSCMTALSGFATSYVQLAVGRIGVGIGEASASPAAYSLLADYFPKRRRGMVMSIYSAGLYIGIGLSLVVGARIATVWEAAYAPGPTPLGLAGWQAAFLFVGLAGLPVAVLVAMLREPLRGGMDGTPTPVVVAGAWGRFLAELATILPPFTVWSASRHRGGLVANLALAAALAVGAALLIALTGDTAQWSAFGLGVYCVGSWVQMLGVSDRPTYRLICTSPVVLLGLVGFGMIAAFGHTFSFWAAPYSMRELGATREMAALFLGLPGAFFSACGAILGGILSDAWKARDPRGRFFVCMLALALPPPFIILLLQQKEFANFAMLASVVYLTSSLGVGSGVAAFQDLVLPRMRGVIGAVTVLAATMIGLALGPYVVGKISTVSGSLTAGMYGLLLAAPIGLVAFYLASRMTAAAEASKFERAAAAGEGVATAVVL